MSCRIAVADGLVESGCDQHAVLDHHCSDRNLAQRPGVVGLIQCQPHERLVRIRWHLATLADLDRLRGPLQPGGRCALASHSHSMQPNIFNPL